VWNEVIALLGDPDRLKAMAAEWVGMTVGDQSQYTQRIADLERQIKDGQEAIATTITEYAKAGLPAAAVQAATRTLTQEAEQLQAMYREATAWLKESERSQSRAHDLRAVADLARDRLHNMPVTEQAEVYALLDVRVTISGPVPKPRLGKACSLARWFDEHHRPVPDELTDQQWTCIEPIVRAWEPPHHRLLPGRNVINALLYKARTGQRWCDLPTHYGNGNSIHSRYTKWLKDGTWDKIMSKLPATGTPPPEPEKVPSLRVEGRVDPRLVTGAESAPEYTGPPGPVTSGLSAGVHQLLREDGSLVTDAAEVIELVGSMGELAPRKRGPSVPRDVLPGEAALVLDALPARGAAESEQLAQAVGITPDSAIVRLQELCALGFVERLGNGWQLSPSAASGAGARHTIE
jgi:hypothetical protein